MLMNKNNKGFSLVEIVVVIAITAIITTGSIIGLSMLKGLKASKCCEMLTYALREVKTEQMGRDSVKLLLKADSDAYIATKVSYAYKVVGDELKKDEVNTVAADTPSKLGETSAISIELSFRKKNEFGRESSATERTINLEDVSGVTIGFERSTGSFLPAEIDGTVDYFSSTDRYYLYKVTVTQGTVSKTVTCEQLTGQVFNN